MAAPPSPFGFVGIPGTIPLASMRPPLIQGNPLIMPLNVPNPSQLPSSLTQPLAQSTSSVVTGLELSKSYQKPPSVAEMKVATTVFVGNITEKATDSLVRQILLRCGYIVGWKRVQNATGKLQAFGFCEYSDPECTLRSLRLLNGFQLGDKKLNIKVDTNNRKELLKYLMKKKLTKAGEEFDDQVLEREVDKIILKGETDSLETDIDEETKAEDEKVMKAINVLVNENINILSGSKTSDDFRREKDVHESLVAMAIQSGHVDEDSTLDQVDMEDDMKTLVSDEIKRFRQSYQNYDEKQAEARMKRQQARLDDKDKKKDEKSSRKRSRSKSPKKSSRAKSPKKAPRSKSQERRDREKERELRRKEEKERAAKEEEEYEQKLLDRKQAEKERAFKERLRIWEHREKRNTHDVQYEREAEEIKKQKLEKEKKRLLEFLEDYDDEKQDSRYYKGSEFNRRRDDRYAEIEEDERDRKKEKDELEALRLEVMERQIREMEEQQKKKQEELNQEQQENIVNKEEEKPPAETMALTDENIPISKEEDEQKSVSFVKIKLAPPINTPELKSNPNEKTDMGVAHNETEESQLPPKRLTFGLNKKQLSATRSSLEGVFSGEDDAETVKPKKKLYSLMSNSNSAHITAAMAVVPHEGKMTAENRKKLVQSLVNSIPSRREELFNWDLRWNYIDKTLMEKRISPWINKKIVEYIGEPEPTLTEFICNKLAEQVSADGILNDISMVLDDEAEVFVLKLWRLLIYETEAKHLGIAKNY